GADAPVLRGGRGGDLASHAPGPRPRGESRRHRDHPKDEAPDARHAGSDRGSHELRADGDGRDVRSGQPRSKRSAGAGRLEPPEARGHVLSGLGKDKKMAEEMKADAGPTSVSTGVPEIVSVLPLRDAVLFPYAVMPLGAGRESSVRLIEDAMSGSRTM